MRNVSKALIFLFILLSFSAQADYRAFELRIAHEEKGTERLVRSTLDNIQYPEYYPLSVGETIQLIDSWRCWGNTSNFKSLCLKPAEREAQGLDADSAAEPRTRTAPDPTT